MIVMVDYGILIVHLLQLNVQNVGGKEKSMMVATKGGQREEQVKVLRTCSKVLVDGRPRLGISHS